MTRWLEYLNHFSVGVHGISHLKAWPLTWAVGSDTRADSHQTICWNAYINIHMLSHVWVIVSIHIHLSQHISIEQINVWWSFNQWVNTHSVYTFLGHCVVCFRLWKECGKDTLSWVTAKRHNADMGLKWMPSFRGLTYVPCGICSTQAWQCQYTEHLSQVEFWWECLPENDTNSVEKR